MHTTSSLARLLRGLYFRAYPLCERLGFHVTLNHFYSPIPDTRSLGAEFWNHPPAPVGFDLRVDESVQLLDVFRRYQPEYDALPLEKTADPMQYFVNNGEFESVDAEVLYCMIRHFKPRRFFEVGSGNSTLLEAQAVRKNREADGADCELVAFEPYPSAFLEAGVPGVTQVVQSRIQDVPLARFDALEDGDVLFIDSSHVMKTGSDVWTEYLQILPRLKPGVIVHVHDIFLPLDYPREWVMQSFRAWNEQYVLQAFLTFNDRFEVLWPAHAIHLQYPERLESAFRSYTRSTRRPGSIWMRKVR